MCQHSRKSVRRRAVTRSISSFQFFSPFDSFNFRVPARARLIFGNDERGCGGSRTLRIRPWDRIPPYRKGQRNRRMRQTCLEVNLGSWDPRGTSPKGVSSTSRVFQAGYRLPSLGYPVFDANTDPRESFDHLFHRRLVREREQDRGCGQKGVKARIISESRVARTRRASITIGYRRISWRKVTFQFPSFRCLSTLRGLS